MKNDSIKFTLTKHLRSTISLVLDGHQLDLDYFQYIINQEVFILTSLSTIFEVPNDILETLLTLQRKVHAVTEMFDSIAEEAEGVHVPET